jgi:hypothetical protein
MFANCCPTFVLYKDAAIFQYPYINQCKPLFNKAVSYYQSHINSCSNTNMGSTAERKQNLIIVSNRLPLSVKRVNGGFESSISSGGLVTSLSGLTKSTQFQWFGWPGIEVKDPGDREEVSKSLETHNAIPIFLDSTLADEHYNGFSSKLRAPVKHPILIFRPNPLAHSPLPIWRNIRRYPMASI